MKDLLGFQHDATLGQFVFNFILMNAIFLFTFLFRKNRKNEKLSWLLILLFCLFAYWDTDYFTFRKTFYTSMEGFRDPLYYFLSRISFNSYLVFRFYIWGGALLLYKKSLERFRIPLNFSVFVFAVFYLMTFSFGRISLGIALYFYGISVLLNPGHNKVSSNIWGIVFILCSYLGHRAMALLILLTPIILFKPNKKRVCYIIILGIIGSIMVDSLLTQLIAGDIQIGSGTSAEDALLAYASNENELVMNWKFALTSKLRWYSIYILVGYSVWKCFFSKQSDRCSINIKKLVAVCLCVFILAFSLLQFDTIGANEMGERFLLVLGLPLTGIMTYLRKENICSYLTVSILLFPALLYAEGFMLGKILSFY